MRVTIDGVTRQLQPRTAAMVRALVALEARVESIVFGRVVLNFNRAQVAPEVTEGVPAVKVSA